MHRVLNLLTLAARDENKWNGNKFVFIAVLQPHMYGFVESVQYLCIHHLIHSLYLPSKMATQLFICWVYTLVTRFYILFFGSHLSWASKCLYVLTFNTLEYVYFHIILNIQKSWETSPRHIVDFLCRFISCIHLPPFYLSLLSWPFWE